MPAESLTAQPERRDQARDQERPAVLESPLFSTGQLLTDDDLTALVQWTRKKFQFARYRLGWGVVCGLGLSTDPDNENGMIVEPGYAIDPAGNDILVTKETRVSLEDCVKTQTSWKEFAPAAGEMEENLFGGFTTTQVVAVDLALQYKEEHVSPRATMTRGEPRPTAREYTRSRESFSVVCSVNAKDTSAASAEAKRWAQAYDRCLDVVRSYLQEAERATKHEVQRWFRNWVTRHPPRQFQFLIDWIDKQPPDSWAEKEAVQVLFWLVQDARNSFLQNGCLHQSEFYGVPVGRAWIRKIAPPGGRADWRLLALDPYPPYKRLIQSSGWPAAEGQVNVGAAIWRPTGDAAAAMSRLGIRVVDAEDFSLPESVRELEAKLQSGVQIDWDTVGKLQVFDAGALGLRSVGISRK